MFVFLLLFAISAVTAEKDNDSQESNKEQNQEQNVDSGCNESQQQHQEQNQEQNGDGEGNGSCNCTGDQNQEQNKDGGGAHNQEQNGDGEGNGSCNGTGDQNQEQNKDGGGAQNQEKNGAGECNDSEEEKQYQFRNQEREQNGTPNCSQEQKQQQEQNKNNGNGEGSGNESNGKNQYRWRYQYRYQIQQGIENGTVVMECNMTKKDGNMYVYSNEYEKGLSVEVGEQNKYKLQLRVSAEFKEGKVLVLNIDENAFQVKNSEKLRVMFDGKEINKGNIEDVIDGEGVEAQYAAAIGEDGGQYIVYIPHFSEHVITLEIIGVTESEAASFISAAIGAAFLTIIVLILIVVRIGKFKRD